MTNFRVNLAYFVKLVEDSASKALSNGQTSQQLKQTICQDNKYYQPYIVLETLLWFKREN